ncbi:MAG: sulfite exporter TauE/SafE family protein [Rhizobiaceae bacterium]|nr:sulfite exporter TauE/SafE family protein [Rhizobiaceae bacterium]
MNAADFAAWGALLLPDGLAPGAALLLVVASFFTSALTAAFGMGGGVAMLAAMGMAMPVAALIPVHGVVQLGSNAGRAWHQRAHVSTLIAKPFLIGSLAGALIGAFTVLNLPDSVMKPLLGLFILATAWWKIPGFDRLQGAGIAVGSGIIAILSMLVGASGPMLSAFFAQLFPDDRKTLVATHAAGMSIHHGLKVVVFGLAGFAFWRWLPFIAAMIASGHAGTVHGSRLLARMPEHSFRSAFKVLLTALALNLIREGVWPSLP